MAGSNIRHRSAYELRAECSRREFRGGVGERCLGYHLSRGAFRSIHHCLRACRSVYGQRGPSESGRQYYGDEHSALHTRQAGATFAKRLHQAEPIFIGFTQETAEMVDGQSGRAAVAT
jgi:hypothetical protein